METGEKGNGERVAMGGLGLEARVVLAGSSMSAADVDKARLSGGLSLERPAGGRAYLEVGGVAVAEGKIARRGGKSAFVVTRLLKKGEEVRL